jgi:DNA-binding response OmpR family regulator
MLETNLDLKKILLVEDNDGDAFLIKKILTSGELPDFQVEHVFNLASAIESLKGGIFYAIVLDLSLPDSQGLDTIRRISEYAAKIPLLVLTGLDDEATNIRALQEGAQDYLFKSEINSANLRRAIRYAVERSRTQESKLQASLQHKTPNSEALTFIQSGNIKLNLVNQTANVFYNNKHQTFDLPPREFKLLFFMMKNEAKPVTRVEILHHVWSDEGVKPNPRCIDTLVSSLKKKSECFEIRIKSIYGTGYKFI